MDPRQKWDSALVPGSPQSPSAEASQEGQAAPLPFSTEQFRMGLSNLTPLVSASLPEPLHEGVFQQQQQQQQHLQQHQEDKSLRKQRWEQLGFQQKKAFLGHLRRRHRDHMAPYRVESNMRVSPSGDRAQNRFRCECRYCQGHGTALAGLAGERKGAPNPSSWETLVQGLSGLTLSRGAARPGLLPQDEQQQKEEEEKRQLERHQESKRMFQRLLKQWLEEN